MYVRIVTMNLKAGERPAYTRVIDEEVIPLLRSFTGFKDQISVVSADEKEVIGINFWERREEAEEYNRTGFPRALRLLEKCTQGKPTVKEYEVTNSTVHAVSAPAPAEPLPA